MPKLKKARKEARISQSELARRSGISQGAIANLEYGRRTGNLRTWRKLAAALNVPITDLI
jgi:transcriptional regulator with XRE-family HTH domain